MTQGRVIAIQWGLLLVLAISLVLALGLGSVTLSPPSTKVYLKGYNLTNEYYESYASTTLGAYAMPERHFVAGVTHSF